MISFSLEPGVSIRGIRPECVLAICALNWIYDSHGYPCIVTSIVDGEHSRGSLHYVGFAVDTRTHHMPEEVRLLLLLDAKEKLGGEFDVILEASHLHAEFQPKRPL